MGSFTSMWNAHTRQKDILSRCSRSESWWAFEVANFLLRNLVEQVHIVGIEMTGVKKTSMNINQAIFRLWNMNMSMMGPPTFMTCPSGKPKEVVKGHRPRSILYMQRQKCGGDSTILFVWAKLWNWTRRMQVIDELKWSTRRWMDCKTMGHSDS